jgi:hypothetical protein
MLLSVMNDLKITNNIFFLMQKETFSELKGEFNIHEQLATANKRGRRIICSTIL